jgi:hypothetical protein
VHVLNIEFPDNVFHLRHPVIPAPDGPLAEPEIHRRLVRALGALHDDDLTGLAEAARQGLDRYDEAFAARLAERPQLAVVAPVILYETLGPALPDGAQAAAALWAAAQMCAATYPESVRGAGLRGEGAALGNALFEAVLAERHGRAPRPHIQRRWARDQLGMDPPRPALRTDRSRDPRTAGRTREPPRRG